ncbi:MAG: hypothetical protein ABIB04_00405 [Patescibacteria group bacterium]
MGSRNFLFFFIISCLAGCGIHNFESKTASDTHTTAVEADVGPFHSRSNITTKYASDYERCLGEYRGYFNAEEICDERMEAARPPDYSQTPYPYGYGYGGYGQNYCNWPGCMAR